MTCCTAHANVCASVSQAVRAWPIWELPPWLVAFIVAVTAVLRRRARRGRLGCPPDRPRPVPVRRPAGLHRSHGRAHQAGRARTPGSIKDVYAVWELPIAILLPPVYALLAPLLRIAFCTQWRVRRIPLHRRVFSAAAVGLSYGVASVGFPRGGPARARTGGSASGVSHVRSGCWPWPLSASLQWAVNQALVLPAIKGADPAMRIRDMLLARERVQQRRRRAVRGRPGHARHSHQPPHDRVRAARSSPCCSARSGTPSWSTPPASTPRPGCSTPVPGNAKPPPRWLVLSVLVPPSPWS